MKKISYILFMMIVAGVFSSCWDENIPGAGAARPRIVDLTATPGDESVTLSWNAPDGYTPTDYLVFYTSGESEEVKITTGGLNSITMDNLENEVQYEFNVQAIYQTLLSNPVSIKAKPTTSRLAIPSWEAVGGDGEITLTWVKPSNNVLSYTLSYYTEGAPGQLESVEIDKELVSYTLDDVNNDTNYYLSLVANYAKGPSNEITAIAMPTKAIPYILSRESVAIKQPMTFTFNSEGYPGATNITWHFPDNTVKAGSEVTGNFTSAGEQTVTLKAKINEVERTWSVIVNVREYVVFSTDWASGASGWNGFKGTTPVFSPDGKTVYIITFNQVSGLYAFNVESGNEKWRFIPENNSGSYNLLTVNPVTGDIYYGTQTAGQFYAVTPEGNLKWTFTEAGSMQGAAPAVNSNGTRVYISDRSSNTFSIDAATGTKIWSYAGGSISSGLLVNGDDLIVGTQQEIHFLNISSGTLITKVTPPAGMVEITGFAVSNDKKNAYFSMRGGHMASLDLEKRSLKETLEVGNSDCYEPVVAPNGTLFVGSKDGNVYNIAGDLSKVNWHHRHADQNNTYNYSHPVVDANNRFIISTGQTASTTYIFNSDGTVADSWQYNTSNDQKQMGGNNFLDGVLYSAMIGASSNNGYFMGKYIGGERANSWSSRGGDICGTSCIK